MCKRSKRGHPTTDIVVGRLCETKMLRILYSYFPGNFGEGAVYVPRFGSIDFFSVPLQSLRILTAYA